MTRIFFTKYGRPLVLLGGPCDTLCAWIGMTMNLPGHLMSVKQHYCNVTTNNWSNLFGLSMSTYVFKQLKDPIVNDCLCAVVLVSNVLRMPLLFWNRRLPSLERRRVEHTYMTKIGSNVPPAYSYKKWKQLKYNTCYGS